MGFWKALLQVTFVFVIVILQLIFALAFGIALLVLYGLYGNNPCGSPLGVYLLVAGVVHLVRALFVLCCSTPTYIIERRNGNERLTGFHQPVVVNMIEAIFSVFLFVWLIIGSIWLWSLGDGSCDSALWYSTFVMIVLAWALAALTFCCTCFIATATCCVLWYFESRSFYILFLYHWVR